MTVSELAKRLQELEAKGFGDYKVVQEYNYDVDIDERDLYDDERGKVLCIW